jgi:hypothetical protein
MTLVRNMLLLLVGIRIKRIVLITLMHQDVNHLQMVRNMLLLLVVKHLRDMNQHLLRVLQVNHLLRQNHLLRVLQVNHLLRVLQVNHLLRLNYS